jgi:hypothetical protein
MAIIYLSHPIHGTKVAILDLEAESDVENGWTIYNPSMPSIVEEVTNTLAVKRKYTRKVAEVEATNEGN